MAQKSAFDLLADRLAQKPGVNDPRALAARVGQQKYGNQVMQSAAKRGVSAKSVARNRAH